MNLESLLDALKLPAGSRVDRRVPKKLLLENGAPTAADKRLIKEGVEELWWVAALKPSTAAIPEYRDEVREYLEIAVLSLTLRPAAGPGRLLELIHRAIPYPVLLIARKGEAVSLSLAHKRWSQGETGKTVLDGELIQAQPDLGRDEDLWGALLDNLALGRRPGVNLYALYQGWVDTVHAYQAACITGMFAMPTAAEHAAARREALDDLKGLETRIAAVRAAAEKEKQLARRVELNLELQRLKNARDAARSKL